jgi:hypothetical protein
MRRDAEGRFVEAEVFQVHGVGQLVNPDAHCGMPRFSFASVSMRL